MRKIAAVIWIFALIGCAELQLSPEAQQVRLIQDTTECQFIKEMYITTNRYDETNPDPWINSLKWQTYHAGGNAYKIISQVEIGPNVGARLPKGKPVTTHIEIYKCQP